MTLVDQLEIFVEEPSMEVALRHLLPKLVHEAGPAWSIYTYQGKLDLLKKLPDRLRGYARWLPASSRVLVVVDRDAQDCRALKADLDRIAKAAGLTPRSVGGAWQVANRIAIEELEAWFFGDADAIRAAFPRVSSTFEKKGALRHPDAISGGTWEALERLLQGAGYFPGGLQKGAAAAAIAAHMDPDRNRSPSFRKFRDVVRELAGTPPASPPPPPQPPLPLSSTDPTVGLAPLAPTATVRGSRWLLRLLWSLEWARRARLGPLRAADLGRILRQQARVEVADPNVARAFRDLRVGETEGLWARSRGNHFAITPAGTGLLLGAMAVGPGAGRTGQEDST